MNETLAALIRAVQLKLVDVRAGDADFGDLVGPLYSATGYLCGVGGVGPDNREWADWHRMLHTIRKECQFFARAGKFVDNRSPLAKLREIRQRLKPLFAEAAKARRELEAVA